MKKYASVIILFFVSIILLSYLAYRKGSFETRTKAPERKLLFAEEHVHIGSLWAELAPFHASFRFSNLTDTEMELYATPCCGSRITFRDEKKVYGPHEDGELTFQITRIPLSHHGPLKRTATIFEKGNKEPLAVLTVTADVKRKWHVFPTALKFGKVSPGETLATKLQIESGTEEQLRVVGLSKPLPPFIKVEQASQTDANNRAKYEYQVSITGDGKQKLIHEKVSFQTNSSMIPVIVIPVYAEMVGPILVEPERIYFGKVEPGANVSKSLRIVSTCGELLVVQHVCCTPNNVSLVNVDALKNHSVGMTFLFSAPAETLGIVRGTLSIKATRTFEDAQAPLEYTVPWIALVESG